jgi:Xaa-Pro dipeptidase
MPNADIFVGPANDPHYHSTNKHRLDTLLAYSDYYSAYNTSFEQYCLYEANRAAIPGHIAAEKAFRSSGSEQEILFSFLQASNQLETLTPYPSVVTLNENAAVLHHQNLNTVRPKNHCSLLIDAGAQYCGYAADITRTYSAMAHGQLFNELLNAMDSLQQQLISEIRAGMSYLTLHERCHEKLAALLIESGICCCSVQETLDTGISRMFFPHGLGHLIGAQVHGQGGHFLDANGAQRKLEENNQYLRLSRKIEDTMAFTVEPGVYFIPQLLEPFRAKIALNWRLIDELYPCGGIRIEDTVLIQQGKAINITRKAFAEN